jgi:putative ABC transport system permease protein
MDVMNKMIYLLVIAAVLLGLIVLYNLGVMSYVERYRELATLKVVGFKDKQIGKILISQNLWLTVLGIIVGIPVGVGVLNILIKALASEYEMVLVLGPVTFIVGIVATLGVSLLVSFLISRKNRKIDMVEALKGVE